MGKKAFAGQATLATAALAGLSLLDGTALAAPPAPVQSWTGFYIGVQGGYGWQDVHYGNPAFTGDADLSGFTGGAIVGYNFQVAPQFVLGFEGGFGFTGFNDTKLIGGADIRSHTHYDWSVRGRAGYLIGPQKLLFVSGGFAGARQEVSFPTITESFNRTGWTIGGGIEKGDFIKGLHVRAEYTYTDYGTKTYFGDLPVGLTQHGVKFTLSTAPEKVIYNGR
jgi:outer membrane immunogenic protein